MKYILSTERLTLRELNTGDAAFIVELVNTPGWLEFIGDRNIHTIEAAIGYLQNGPMKSYHENGYGLSVVETKDNPLKIGICGIIKRDNLDHPDIGFAFLPQYHGQGYAFEMASATLAFATDQLGLKTISAITVANNVRSIKLLEKIGLKFIQTFCFPESKEALQLYRNN